MIDFRSHCVRLLLAVIFFSFHFGPASAQETGWRFVSNVADDRIVALAVSPATGSLFAGARFEGLFRSVDDGRTWTSVLGPDRINDIRGIVVAPNGSVFVGGFGSGVMRSTDDGLTWMQVSEGNVHDLDVDSEGRIYYAPSDNVLRSTDNGATWIPLALPDDPTVGTIAVDRSDAVYAVTQFDVEIYVSADRGENWRKTTFGEQTEAFVIEGLAVNRDGVILAETGVGSALRSTDAGATWVPLTVPTHFFPWYAADSAGAFVLPGPGLYRSEDLGESWTLVNEGWPPKAVSASSVAFFPDGRLGVGTDEGDYVVWGAISSVGASTKEGVAIVGDRLIVDLPGNASGRYPAVEIVDLLGRRMDENVRRISSSDRLTLDLSLLPNGRYLVRIDREGENVVPIVLVR